MGRFLDYNDYATLIQNEDIFQALGEHNTMTWETLSQPTKNILIELEFTAVEEINSYLRGRYLVNDIFIDIRNYSATDVYFGNNLVLFSAVDFSANTIYSSGQTMAYNYNVYECIVSASTTGTTPNLTQFSYIAPNNSFYSVNLPSGILEYNSKTTYYPGQKVWYNNNIYVAIQNVRGINPFESQNLELRYGVPGVYEWYGEKDYLPTNTDFWALNTGQIVPGISGATYQFSGQPITNTTYFTLGDSRNHQIKMYLIDVILYHLHARVNPRNIPKLRALRYNGDGILPEQGAIGWLKGIQRGKINLNLPEIIPAQGKSIRWGSYPKDANRY